MYPQTNKLSTERMIFLSDQVKQIAARIRELREISGISIETLAKELNVDIGLYKEYESGNVDIPVGLLYEIANRFKVDLTAILTGEGPRLHTYCLVRRGKGVNVERKKQYKYLSLAYNFMNKKAEPFHVTVEPDSEETQVHLSSHPGQEFNYVLEGTLMIVIDGHELILNEGDSLYFNSSYMHGMKALNNQTAKFLAIIF